MKRIDKKIIAILGPTASGKSDLAIALAKKYNGEIISADSRQVYRGMDIGTGKVTRDKVASHHDKYFFSKGIRHHLIDVASPKRNYNVTHFVRDAKKAITDIQKRGLLSIICGGTGFWAQALLEGTNFPPVKPDFKFRKKLAKFSAEKLFEILQKKDLARARTIDRHNKTRLIRALEIIETLGKVPSLSTKNQKLLPVRQAEKTENYLVIALNPAKETLQKNIRERLEKRLKKGMVAEVKKLKSEGLSWQRLENFGLEYKNVALFLQKKISGTEMREKLLREILQYTKRQITWLKRWERSGARIQWVSKPEGAKNLLR